MSFFKYILNKFYIFKGIELYLNEFGVILTLFFCFKLLILYSPLFESLSKIFISLLKHYFYY